MKRKGDKMIRNAKKEEAGKVVPLVLDAIHDIAQMLTGGETEEEVLALMEQFFQEEGNRLSYQNTYVKEIDGNIAGIMVLYYGADVERLDVPLLKNLHKKGIEIEAFDVEADLDEFYIDTVSVSKDYQGQGLGTELLAAAEEIGKQKGYEKISLNVDKENPRAHQLYSRLNYVSTKEISINHHSFFHMVKSLTEAN